ncbi:copper resistance protein CopC [Phaeobacter italicus]|uniref:copper resistance CopC family protein n=1 Tax=Phaeobacter italicus TaxID=481446 RepID=UPI001ADCBC98|nr:copper resistance protein CopC [Phaeobacter italicus]
MRTLALAGVFSALAGLALAHSPLRTTTPADGAVLAEVPQVLELQFGKDIRLTRITSTHVGAHSKQLDLSAEAGFVRSYALPFEGMGAGDYVIEWRGLGDDGHPQSGSFAFRVD